MDYSRVVALYRAFAAEPHTDAEVLDFLQRAEALTLAVEADHAIACHAVDLLLLPFEFARAGISPATRPRRSKKGLPAQQ